ncbi:flagellar hook-basal body complex protein FliE [Magnetococcales bacterium HHB-1]
MAVGSVQLPQMMPSLPSLSLDSAATKGSAGFSDMLMQQIKEVDRREKEARELGRKALLGNAGVSIHEAQIASSEAELQMRFLLQVRNKVVEVYKEVVNMQA